MIVLILIISICFQFSNYYKDSHVGTGSCFLEGNRFLENIGGDVLVITDQSSLVYYYTKKETHFYPNPWSLGFLKAMVEESYFEKEVYFLFTDYGNPFSEEKYIQIKGDLDANFEKSFECYKGDGFTIIYEYN